MKKKDVFSMITNPIRNSIMKRLAQAEKAAYSDLLDSTDIQRTLSTGNFNYHLNYLQENAIIVKNGGVYRLTNKGKEVAKFMEKVEKKWEELKKKIRGDNMSIFAIAEHFEEETNIRMEKEVMKYNELEMIMDEKQIIGIMPIKAIPEAFQSYTLIPNEEFQFTQLSIDKKENKKKQKISLLTHPKLQYQLSPKWLGIIQHYLETTYGKSYIYAKAQEPTPFLICSKKFERDNDEDGCLFVIAPAVFDEKIRKKISGKKHNK
jgi:predicted transcriptional regulator